jgi:predicted RecA/RadA family phage recombinase
MPAEFYHAGSHVDYTPSAAYTAGTPVALGTNFFGIGANDIDANRKGSLTIGGVFKMPKIAATVLAAGATVGYDLSADEVVTSADTNSDGDIGTVVYDAASADAYVYVLLNGMNI